jgi:ribosomal protein L40E
MAAMVCLECTATYSVGAQNCPQCGSTDARGDWEEPAPAPAAAAKRAKSAPTATDPAPVVGGASGSGG